MKFTVPLDATPEPPMFRSRFGGLWIDRRDAHDILADRLARGLVTEADAEILGHYIDHGYVILPKATDEGVIDEYLEFFERAWDEAPSTIWAHSGGTTQPMTRALYDKVAKVSCLHCYFERAGDLIFPPAVLRFLTQIYDRPPVAFQTMTMRKGSEEPLHIDTGPLSLTEPMSMCASWVALEDVKPNSGEFWYVPGTHQLPEVLHRGVAKAHDGDMATYGQVLNRTHELSAERGLETQYFRAKKGDVLLWHADLMHGGAPIADPATTRLSLVAHFMPLGVMPTFYDFSEVKAYPYPNGGYCLDNLLTSKDKASLETAEEGIEEGAPTPAAMARPKSWKEQIPMPIRAFVRRHVDQLSSNHH